MLLQKLNSKLQPTGAALSPLESFIEHEDPRLFVADGKLFLAYIELNGRHRDGLFTQELVELSADLKSARRIPLNYGNNGTKTEKNWIFFDAGSGRIGIVYSLCPHKVAIISVEDGRLLEQHTTRGIAGWNFGTLSGGTPAMRASDDTFIHFLHSYIPHARRQRQYSVSAAIFSANAPYACIGVSEKPLVWASEEDPAIVNPRRPNWNPLCIFPAGLVEHDGTWLVSCGINDSSIALLKISNPLFVTPENTAKRSAIGSEFAPEGSVRVRVTPGPHGKPRNIGEPSGRYFTGDEFFTTPERAAALGSQVEVLA